MIRMSTGHMEGNLQLLYVLLTDCYVYLLRKGACHPRPERAGLSSPAPALYPHFKHILMTRCPQGGTASWATHPHPVCRSAPLLLGTEGAGEGERPARVMGAVISSLRGHGETIPGGRSRFLQ